QREPCAQTNGTVNPHQANLSPCGVARGKSILSTCHCRRVELIGTGWKPKRGPRFSGETRVNRSWPTWLCRELTAPKLRQSSREFSSKEARRFAGLVSGRF